VRSGTGRPRRVPAGRDKHPDAAAAEIAARQDGAVSTAQLVAVGLSRRAIAHRVSTGRLQRVHRGVYLLGPVRGPRAAEWAAILACGPRAVLSHRTALALWGLGDGPPDGDVEITHPRSGRDHDGVRRRRSERIDDRDRAVLHDLPVTSPTRTLLDLASSMRRWELERLIEEAQLRHLAGRDDLYAALERGRGRTGAPAFRAALAREDEPKLTRSQAERRLLDLIRAARLPGPETNVSLARYEVDFLWREQRLVVEVDGFAYHSSRAAFERDRLRDAELQAMGYRILRVTWRRLVDEPEALLAQIATLLARA
jgi:very-short-patch-repair endonuclease